MPTPSLLLLPLKRLLSLIPSVLGLFPVLLRPPPMPARLSPLALPPFVPRLPTFALRPLAFLPTPSNHSRRPAAKRPASCPFDLWERVGACPGRDPGVRVFRSRRHPAAPSHRAVPTSPQTPQKSTPRRLKSFLEKTLSARETPTSAHSSHPHHGSAQPPSAAASSRHPGVFSRDPAPRSVPAHPCHPDLPSIPSPPSPLFSLLTSLPLTPSSPPPSRRSPAPKNRQISRPPAGNTRKGFPAGGREYPPKRAASLPYPVTRIRGCTSATDTQTRGIAIPGPGRITVTTGARCPPE